MSWSVVESAVAGFVLGGVTLAFAAVTNINSARQTGGSNIEVARIQANSSDNASMERRITDLENSRDDAAEVILRRGIELIAAKANETEARAAEVAARMEAIREKERADRETRRADMAETELVSLNLRFKNLKAAFRALLETVTIPEVNKRHINQLLCDEAEIVSENDIRSVGQF